MFSFLKKFWAGFFFKNATTPPPQKVHPHPPPRGTDGHWWLSFFSFFYSAPSGAISYFFYGGEGCGKIWWKNHWWLWLTTDGTLTYDNIIWIFFSKLCCDKVILPVAVLVKIRCTSRSPSMNPWWAWATPRKTFLGHIFLSTRTHIFKKYSVLSGCSHFWKSFGPDFFSKMQPHPPPKKCTHTPPPVERMGTDGFRFFRFFTRRHQAPSVIFSTGGRGVEKFDEKIIDGCG